MKYKNWAHLNNEELLDEIEYSKAFLNHVLEGRLKVNNKEDAVNEYLDKLKSLYDEKRKRRIT
jgi:hypothetical protein